MQAAVSIIGGSDAGISAALRAREVDPTWTRCASSSPIASRTYSICGLPFYLSGETPRWESLAHRTRQEIEEQGHRVAPRHRRRAHRSGRSSCPGARGQRGGPRADLRPPRGRYGCHAGEAPESGASRRRPSTSCTRWRTASRCTSACLRRRRSPRSSWARATSASRPPTRYGIGVWKSPCSRPWPTCSRPWTRNSADGCRRELEQHGVHVRLGVPYRHRRTRGPRRRCHGPRGSSRVQADLVLVATGVRPSSSWLVPPAPDRRAGRAARQPRDGDQRLPDVYAAGDCVETHHRLTEVATYLPLGTTAHKQGRVAGENAVGGRRAIRGQSWHAGRQGLRPRRRYGPGSGTTRRAATASILSPRRRPGLGPQGLLPRRDRDPPPRHRRSPHGPFLGAQVARRVRRRDLEAHRRLRDGDLPRHARRATSSALDLSYTPPLSSPWDPVQTSCMDWAGDRLGRKTMKTVLFACIHNAGRSQMAAAWFNALADRGKGARDLGGHGAGRSRPPRGTHRDARGRHRARRASLRRSSPTGLRRLRRSSSRWGAARRARRPGAASMDWPLEDPKGKPVERVREIRDDVRKRVAELLREQGWAKG